MRLTGFFGQRGPQFAFRVVERQRGPSSNTSSAARESPNLAGEKGLRLWITWGMLGKRPVGESLAMLARLGYDAFEMFDWRNAALLEDFATEKNKVPMVCACLVANKGVTAPGCGLVNPRERE